MFLAIRANFDPFMGPSRLIFGFEAVIIGGISNLQRGTLRWRLIVLGLNGGENSWRRVNPELAIAGGTYRIPAVILPESSPARRVSRIDSVKPADDLCVSTRASLLAIQGNRSP